MADNTLSRFARLLTGVVLTEGHLGHQVLGQLLIFNATEVEVAGANLALAATARQRGVFAQVAIRTAVPALAVHALIRKREKQLEARERRLIQGDDVERRATRHAARPSSRVDAAAKLAALDAENRALRASRADASAKLAALDAERRALRSSHADAAATLAALDAEKCALQSSHADAVAKLAALSAENHKLRGQIVAQRAAPAASPDEPPEPPSTRPRPTRPPKKGRRA